MSIVVFSSALRTTHSKRQQNKRIYGYNVKRVRTHSLHHLPSM
ncbi:UNVERIFIED_CONTAM: hypothetical protein NCL1_36721 [Trichonephila clavipes]